MTTTSTTQTGLLFRLQWTLDADEDVEIRRTSEDPDLFLATVEAGINEYIDRIATAEVDDVITWTLTGVDTSEVTTITYTVEAVEDYTYGEVDPLGASIRYTTLAAVKSRLGISSSTHDTALTQSIIAAEIQIDQYLGRSFPDTGTNPEIEGIPIPIKEAATLAAMTVWKMGDAPTGYAGGDYLNEIDVARSLWQQFDRNPLLTGYHATGGLA